MTSHGPHLALVGPAGVGKSAVAIRLGRLSGRPVVDLDDAIEARDGRTVPEIFDEGGEAAFRVLESQVLADVLGAEVPTIISTGGGVVVSSANVERLRDRATCVWLQAPVEVLADRLRRSHVPRPLLVGDGPALEDRLSRQLAEREPRYRACAHVVVDIAAMTADEAARAVAAAVGLEAAVSADRGADR